MFVITRGYVPTLPLDHLVGCSHHWMSGGITVLARDHMAGRKYTGHWFVVSEMYTAPRKWTVQSCSINQVLYNIII